MPGKAKTSTDRVVAFPGFGAYSLAAMVGFACNQGFLLSLFYTGENRAVSWGNVAFERADLFGSLLFMVLAFALLHFASDRARSAALVRPLLWCYAALAVVGSVAPLLFGDSFAGIVLESALIGLSSGTLLAAWGRVLAGCEDRQRFVIILAGAALGAAFCLLAFLLPIPNFSLVLKLLPLGSASALVGLYRERPPLQRVAGALTWADLVSTKEQRQETKRLSYKMLLGMGMFGLAAGIMETFGTEPGMESVSAFPASLIMFLLLLMAVLQQLKESRSSSVDSLKEKAPDPSSKENPLDGMYRIAVLVAMAGFLLVPPLQPYGVSGQAICLAGYLGLTYVLVSLFVVMARIAETDPALSLSAGFFALYAGEATGIAFGNVFDLVHLADQAYSPVVAIAGLLFLFAYLFLFTERDFDALTQLAASADTFEETCRVMAAEYALSPREAEVLPLALKGRTGERIAAELFISKSTVDTHLRRIYQKVGVRGRQGLIDIAEQQFGLNA